MKININWEMNFFVYSLTTTSFFENKGDSYQINEALKNLKEVTWKINNKSGVKKGDYILTDVTIIQKEKFTKKLQN